MENLKSQFLIDPEITFLNFGSFGACPKPVFENYQKWQLELEREAVQFMTVNGPRYIKASRDALASYVHCDAEDLVFVTNPSYAVNIVAKSLDLKPGDEILSSNIEYGACDKTWEFYCHKKGAKYVRQKIDLPLTSKEKFVEDLFKGLSSKTKMVFLSHITSSTALKFPVKEICAAAKEKGLITFVDGAHAPGHVPLNLSDLGADIYTGACHKWMMAPKGCSFLYVKKEFQPFDPLIISWGYNNPRPIASPFQEYHQLQGTRDFSAFLTVPACIEFMRKNNWDQVSADCRKLVRNNARRFCDLLGSKPNSPLSDEFLGQMFSIPIQTSEPEKLQRHLFESYKIEIPVMRQDDKVYLRYSINAFNSQSDLNQLYAAVKDILSTTDLIKSKDHSLRNF